MSYDPPCVPGSAKPDERATHRFAFLASACEVLSSSRDYEQTLRHVAQLAVPELGDLCIVDVVEDGQLRRVATAHTDPEKAALIEELARRYPATPESGVPATHALASGRTQLHETVTPAVVAARTVDAGHARQVEAIGIRSYLAVPMKARGAIVGVISLGITESDRRYTQDEAGFAEELARRAALSVDNARLYRAAQHEVERRQQVEAELRLSERRYRAILEQSPLSTQILAPDGRTLGVNRAWESLWGLTPAQLEGYNVLQDPQLDANGITPLLQRAFAGEQVALPTIAYEPEGSLSRRLGSVAPLRWVSAFAYPVRDDDGTVREVVLVHRDVTEPHRAEAQLRASEERLRRALMAGRMNVWDWDLSSDIVECSDNALEFWGISIGRAADFLTVIHPDDLAMVREAARAAIEDGAPYLVEYRLRASDGAIRWVQSRAHVERDADGRAVRLLGVTMDVSERKQAEEASRLLAEAGRTLGTSLDYEATLSNLAHVVVPQLADWYAIDLVNEDGELERVSVHHPDPARVALAQQLFVRYPPARGRSGAWNVIDTGEVEWAASIDPDQLELAAHDADHLALLRDLDLRSYICVPLQARGVTLGVLTLVQAESGRRYRQSDVGLVVELARRVAAAVDNARLYRQLQVEARRKNEFLATLAHELRNPLAPIRNGLALLQAAPGDPAAGRTLRIMERQLGHMVRLVDDLLDLSRVTRGTIELRREPLEIASVIGSAVDSSRSLIDAAGLELTIELPDAPVELDADPTRLAQVVTNLLNNAAKFTAPGGRIRLAVRDAGPDVLVEVEDTGVGLDASQLEQVFEMFSRTTDPRFQGGLGIGLTLARRLVQLHGGALWAESEGPGRGSRFSLRLPARRAPATGAVASDGAPAVGTSMRRVLVVDDNVDAAETLAEVLALHGHAVRTASSGAEALATAREFVPEIAFLDIGLPEMNGHELARRLRALPQLAQATLVALTGWGREEDRELSRQSGFDHHLTKPADVDAVLALLAGDSTD